jgi:hypothetical protein
MIYLKKQLVGSEDFNVVRVDDEDAELFKSNGYAEATEEEYVKQFADRTAPITSEEDQALGEMPVTEEKVSEEAIATE